MLQLELRRLVPPRITSWFPEYLYHLELLRLRLLLLPLMALRLRLPLPNPDSLLLLLLLPFLLLFLLYRRVLSAGCSRCAPWGGGGREREREREFIRNTNETP
jgi:hypothetical protein